MEDDAPYLICALADAPIAVEGSIFTHACHRCQRKVMTAPSGQKILERYPKAVIVCHRCYYKLPKAGATFEIAASSPAEMLREAKTLIPNMRRYRN